MVAINACDTGQEWQGSRVHKGHVLATASAAISAHEKGLDTATIEGTWDDFGTSREIDAADACTSVGSGGMRGGGTRGERGGP